MAEPVTDWMTPREAARHLNLSERTVMHWIAQAWVVAEAEEHGQTRRHRVSLSSVQAHLARRQLGARSGAPAELPEEIERLLDRIDELEKFKQQVEATALFRVAIRQRGEPAAAPPSVVVPRAAAGAGESLSVPPAVPRRNTPGSTIGDDFPAGWLSLDEFCDMHAMARSTLTSRESKQEAAQLHLYHMLADAPHPRGWKRGRVYISMAVSPDQRAALLMRWPPKRRCQLPDCPCQGEDDLAELDRELDALSEGEG